MPAASGSVTQIETSAATAAELAGTPDDQFKDGDLACVTALWPNSTFRLRRTAAGAAPTADNVAIIATFTGNGYWEVFNQGGGSTLVFPTVEDLKAYDDLALPDGATVYVQSIRSYWHKLIADDPTAFDAVDMVCVQSTPNPTTFWYRDSEASPSWLNAGLRYRTWYIDGAGGDDENEGHTSNTALRTHDEFMRRIGKNVLTQSLTVQFVTAFTGNFVHALETGQHGIDLGGGCYKIRYKGTALDLLPRIYEGSFTDFTPIDVDGGNGERTNFSTLLPDEDWNTLYAGKIIVVVDAVDPDKIGSYAWVDIASGGVVYTSAFTQASSANGGDTEIIDPDNGDSYAIVDPLTFNPSAFFVADGDENEMVGTTTTFDFLSNDVAVIAAVGSGRVEFNGCLMAVLAVNATANLGMYGCRIGFLSAFGASYLSIQACYIDGRRLVPTLDGADTSRVALGSDTLWVEKGTLTISNRLSLGNLGAFDFTIGSVVPIVFLTTGGQISIESAAYLYGSNNSNPFFQLYSFSRVISASSNFLASTGVAKNVSFGGGVEKDWADLPFIANALVGDSQAAWVDLVSS